MSGSRTARVLQLGASGVALAVGLAQAALLRADVAFLADIVAEQKAILQIQLEQRSIDVSASDPFGQVEAAIFNAADRGAQQDPFLTQLAQSLSALPKASKTSLQDLRFDAATGSLTVLLTAEGLQDLQAAESALLAAGIAVSSGAATRTDAGAEVQLIIQGEV
mgnify:CR=1 FL=1